MALTNRALPGLFLLVADEPRFRPADGFLPFWRVSSAVLNVIVNYFSKNMQKNTLKIKSIYSNLFPF